MGSLTKSCSPTVVITADGEVQTDEEAIVYVKELEKFLTMKSFAMKTGIPTNGSMVKNHISLKTGFGLSATRKFRSYRGFRLVKFVLWIFMNSQDTYETGDSFFFIFFTYSRWNSGSRKGRCTSQWHLSSASVWVGWRWIRALMKSKPTVNKKRNPR